MPSSIGGLPVLIMLLFFVFIILVNEETFDKYCDYQFKELFEIEEFEVSAGGFSSPTLLNIKTVEGKNKVITLKQVYDSISEIREGDIIVCEEAKKQKIFCSSKIKCKKIE